MGKLHELIAVEPDLKTKAEKIEEEGIATFTKRHDHFQGSNKHYEALKSDDIETFPDENKEMVTTVQAKLDYIKEAVVDMIDAMYQKEQTNTLARADLEVQGKILAKDVPATVLLNLETKLKNIRKIYLSVPTLDPARAWKKDENLKNVYVSELEYKFRTRKDIRAFVLYEATDKHPAQIEKISEDIRVGTWTTKNFSGMLSPKEKSDLLGRIDILIQAVKQSRCRANNAEVMNVHIGEVLFNFIHKG